jgi:hypothetical protein
VYAERSGDGHSFSIQYFQNVGTRARDAIYVKLKVAFGALDPPSVKQYQCRMKDCAHIVQTGVKHVGGGNELGIRFTQYFQYVTGARGWQGSQRYGVLAAKDAGLSWSGTAAGKDKGTSLGYDDVGGATCLV